MADLCQLAGLTLPPGVAHESLSRTVARFVSDCWHGMSRMQVIARAKRHGVRTATPACSNCASTMGLWNVRCWHGCSRSTAVAVNTRKPAGLMFPCPRHAIPRRRGCSDAMDQVAAQRAARYARRLQRIRSQTCGV